MTSTLTRAGQTTVPANIRRLAGWPAGATLDWQVDRDAVVVRRRAPAADAKTVRLVRRRGRLVFPAGFKVASAALADALREERDGR